MTFRTYCKLDRSEAFAAIKVLIKGEYVAELVSALVRVCIIINFPFLFLLLIISLIYHYYHLFVVPTFYGELDLA